MGRDFEITSYFPHVELSPGRLRRLFRALADGGLRVQAPSGEAYPVFEGLAASPAGVRIQTDDVEALLRARTGTLPRGYGVIPLHGNARGVGETATGTLQFQARSVSWPDLDAVHLRIDDAILRREGTGPSGATPPGWEAVLEWYATLCEQLRVAYGYGDWEDLFLQFVVPPSRADVLGGRVDRLFRVNCFGPRLVTQFGSARVHSTPAEVVVKLRYGGALVASGLRYAGDGSERSREAAEHLGLL